MNIRVLLVEDNIDLANTILQFLKWEGIESDFVGNGQAGLNLARKNTYDVFVLDINLPGLDGLSLCQQLRADGIDAPVLMLTARDTLADKLAGFDAGTDDYLVKPFSLEELHVRLLALARRRSGQVRKLTVADLEMDLESKQVQCAGNSLSLSPTCWKLLETLMRKSPEVVSREDLEQAIWGDEPPDSNNLKVHLHKLRKQINDYSATLAVSTVRGYGYVLKAEG